MPEIEGKVGINRKIRDILGIFMGLFLCLLLNLGFWDERERRIVVGVGGDRREKGV